MSRSGALSAAELDPVESEVVELFASPVEVELDEEPPAELLELADAVVTADPTPPEKPVESPLLPQATVASRTPAARGERMRASV